MPRLKKNKDRNYLDSFEDHGIDYFEKELDLTSRAIAGAKKATGSSDRRVLRQYLNTHK